jgi:phosphatidylglycerophosphatase A
VTRAASLPWFKQAVVLLAQGFGLGRSPVAPGTVGSLWGLGLVWLMHRIPGWPLQLVYALLLSALAIPICSLAESVLGKKDDGRIVADEFMTFPVCMLGLPFEPWVIGMAFVVNRGFDILKPPPADRFQRLRGGLGIVADDFVACLYALAFSHLVLLVLRNL